MKLICVKSAVKLTNQPTHLMAIFQVNLG